jgi:hypothetical protein
MSAAQSGHLVEHRDPRDALLGCLGVGGPDVLVAEDQDAADDRACAGLPR